MANSSTPGGRSGKPRKPRPDFPLFPHATGRWAKKIKGRLVYFGKTSDDPQGQAALAKWLDEKDDLLAGRKPRGKATGPTIKDLLNHFRASKKLAADSGEITPRAFAEYHRTMDRIRDIFGLSGLVLDLTAQDFEQLRASISETMGLTATKTEIQKTRAVFNYAYASGLIDRPVRFGPGFTVSEKAIRRTRGQNGPKMFEREEVHKLLAASCPAMRAMILLAVNCGFGNNDLATLPRSALDLEGGWVTHPRPKTGARRRCKLWPETVKALREVYATRPEPKDPADADLVFLTRRNGDRYIRFNGKAWTDGVQSVFTLVMEKAGVRRPGRGFYALRHTTETIGSESLDQVALDFIMGHLRGDMASVYRERIDDARLVAVTDHVRQWLFGVAADEAKAPVVANQGTTEVAGRSGLKIVG